VVPYAAVMLLESGGSYVSISRNQVGELAAMIHYKRYGGDSWKSGLLAVSIAEEMVRNSHI